jgi:hypothetical protein
MDKLIGRWSYWVGVSCAAIATLWRLANALNLLPASTGRSGIDISYLSFLHFSFVLFLVTMATACYAWMSSQSK